MRKFILFAVTGLMVVVALGAGFGLQAQSPEFRPPRIGFLDMQHVIQEYDRAIKAERQLVEAAEKIKATFDQKARELKEREANLDLMSEEETQEYQIERQKIAEDGFRLQWMRKAALEKVAKEARDEMASIYREIQSAVERYAANVGLDAVLVSSESDLLGASLAEVKLQIAVRPVLYCKDDLEITKPILAMLNAGSGEDDD